MSGRVVRRLGPDGPETLAFSPDGTLAPSDAEPTHWLLRAPLNAHTHVGDAFLTGRVPAASLAETVGPDGFKHRELSQVAPATAIEAIRRTLAEYARAGCRRFVDFREGGVEGVRWLRQPIDETDEAPHATILGRPDAADADASAVLAESAGLGFSSLADDAERDLAAMADACHRAGAMFAIHLSEAKREDVDAALALEPDLLVHLCKASRGDLARIADEDVPVAVCPSSNARFGLTPPVAALEEERVDWFLGTDNAMFGGRSVLAEAALVRAQHPELPDARIVRALEADVAEPRWGIDVAPDPAPVLLPLDPAGRIEWDAPMQRARIARPA